MALGDVLLGVLVDGPAHGYDLKQAHDERFPAARSLAFGQVYATLARLERDGLVDVIETSQAAGPERRVYALTDAGRTQLTSWLEHAEEPGSFAADELVRKTVTALHSGHDASGFLQRQREVHLSAMRRLTQQLREADSVDAQIAIDHALAHLDAELRWLADARDRVRSARRGTPGRSTRRAAEKGRTDESA
jgi:DNA-binding PadR family transcriptional regulator